MNADPDKPGNCEHTPPATHDEAARVSSQPPRRLLDRIRDRIRYKHYSVRTERAYVDWARRFIIYHGKRHPLSLGAVEIEAFLAHLVAERNVSASTHQQALAALLFLYKEVLGIDLPWLGDIGHPKKPKRLPAVLTQDEVRRLLVKLDPQHKLMGRLTYAAACA